MNRPLPAAADDDADADLSIGDLAERTGVAAATLRVWEARYGFPVPQRRASGHRRYTERDVETVSEVVRRRDGGVRLDVAIEQSLTYQPVAGRAPESRSVFAQLRRTHPALMPHRLHKSTLLALSWAIEDEFCARAEPAHVFGAFQRQANFERARARWSEVARASGSTFVFADFDQTRAGLPHEVAVTDGSALGREWAVVCDAGTLPVALAGWELPGQQMMVDGARLFEAIWTVDATAVREAARVCACVAAESGSREASAVVDELAGPAPQTLDPSATTASLFNRVIAYVDTPPPR